MNTTKITTLAAAIAAMLLAASAAMAQDINPAFPLITKQWGLVGTDTPDVVLDNTEPLNPARQGSVPLHSMAETDYGTLRSGSLTTTWKIGSLMLDKGRTALRISYNGLSSTTGQVPVTGPLSISHSGDAVEIVGGYAVNGHLSLGAAIAPEDTNRVRLTADGAPVAQGISRSDFQGRVGAYLSYGQFGFGAETGTERGHVSSQIEGMGSANSNYTQNHTTYGIAWRPALGTTVFYDKQNIRLVDGDAGIRESSNTDCWGLDQWVSHQLGFRLARSGTASAISATWLPTPATSISFSYADRAFSGSESLMGTSKLIFISATVSR